jgi:hypothetical protein
MNIREAVYLVWWLTPWREMGMSPSEWRATHLFWPWEPVE